ncbi:MAG: ABC transporter substrate-binding protein [Peptoniphilus harei]|nr:ABC transporter substrate-binding protein [Peptoniphilus harei]
MKNLRKLLILILVGLFLTGCGKKEDAKAEEGKDLPKEKVSFLLDWEPNVNHAGLYVAMDKGFFEEEGIEVEVNQPPANGAEALVASGKADFGVSYQDTIAPAFASDEPLPVTALAAIINHNTSGIISLKEKGIERPKDMEGHNYATWGLPIEQAILKQVITDDGGDFSKVELLPENVVNAVQAISGKIDSVWVFFQVDGVLAAKENVPINYFAFRDISPVFDYYTPILIANNDFLNIKEDVAKRFMRAFIKGYEYAAENPKEAAEILVKINPELDKDFVEQGMEYLADKYQDDAKYFGQIDPDRWNNFYQWLWENKLIDKEIPKDFGFTDDFVNPEKLK